MKQRLLIFVILFLVSLPIAYPFLQAGYFPTHDGEWAIVRLAEMHRELKLFQIPPRWAGYLNHGYGYPLFQFTYPGPYLIAETFNLIGFGLTDSIKILFSLTVFLSGGFMFLLGKKIWGTGGGLISAVLYLYAPYRMTNLFVRGSIGESVVFVLMPLLFWLFLQLSQKPTMRLILITSSSLALLNISHNALSLLFLPVLFVWCATLYLKNRNKQVLFSFGLIWLLGFGLSSWFWLPAVLEKEFIRLSIIPLADRITHFVTFNELLSGNWGFGTRPPLRIGLIHFGLGIISLILLALDLVKVKKFDHRKVAGGMLMVSFGLLFAISSYFWELPFYNKIDFPWRMLGIVMFLLALVGGVIVRGKYKKAIVVILVLGTIMLNIKYVTTQERIYKEDSYYSTNDATTTSANELMPIWVTKDPTIRPETKVASAGYGYVNVVKDKGQSLVLSTEFPDITVGSVKINTVYFPGWKAYLGEMQIPLTADKDGLINISVPAGIHRIELKYERTPIRWTADLITLISFIVSATTMYRYIVVDKKVIK